ncbi:uncharacterized protein EDB91DRAFT_1107819 [Suillus paluster]|uniref:uncharacterized protein n=1 Tax=Suillus paluster TaxID=48578 RepID=UPI001B86357B|nr:uncharacterized protein EDB91DRAFT_1107819 [Suillus paluster]KAG1750506.1 hypothetical protein EDB91DRAFT_1107819 [Suillus paluster]
MRFSFLLTIVTALTTSIKKTPSARARATNHAAILLLVYSVMMSMVQCRNLAAGTSGNNQYRRRHGDNYIGICRHRSAM